MFSSPRPTSSPIYKNFSRAVNCPAKNNSLLTAGSSNFNDMMNCTLQCLTIIKSNDLIYLFPTT